MAIYCLACGKDIANERGRRLLQSESSRNVLPLWSSLFGEEVQGRGVEVDVMDFVRSGGKVCRSCFVALEKCTKILEGAKDSMRKAVDVGLNVGPGAQQQNSRAFYIPPTFAVPSTQPLAPQGPCPSPDVTVSLPL